MYMQCLCIAATHCNCWHNCALFNNLIRLANTFVACEKDELFADLSFIKRPLIHMMGTFGASLLEQISMRKMCSISASTNKRWAVHDNRFAKDLGRGSSPRDTVWQSGKRFVSKKKTILLSSMDAYIIDGTLMKQQSYELVCCCMFNKDL